MLQAEFVIHSKIMECITTIHWCKVCEDIQYKKINNKLISQIKITVCPMCLRQLLHRHTTMLKFDMPFTLSLFPKFRSDEEFCGVLERHQF